MSAAQHALGARLDLQGGIWPRVSGRRAGQGLFGAMLRDGVGGPADVDRAGQMLRAAIDANPPIGFAQYQLALTYDHGTGNLSDRELAGEYLREGRSPTG